MYNKFTSQQKFSLPVSVILLNDTAEVSGKSLKAQGVKANVRFADDVEDVQVKVGISPVSIENAAQNIVSEIRNGILSSCRTND